MTFKNREVKYNILFKSNLSTADIAKVLDVSESTVLKVKLNILGEIASGLSNTETSSVSSSDVDVDTLARDATCEAYRLEGERDSFYKSFYSIANSYVSSHFKYKKLTLRSAFKKLIDVNEEILNLEREISNSDDKNLCKKLKLDLRQKIYKRDRISRELILNDMREDYECLVKLKEIFDKGLKLG
ncbi:hypothetical protein A7978_04830 (plasmid) [Borrelia turicatae]|uniref:Uncharacterized protein n=2 Tax=Borrelia turicatae TaxID=142 RepID=T1ECQ4_BORT9|nr:hypothetical protein [Borrelia turicatae]ADN26527.1 hypothetical protein BTA099 [Borrelia turicatae 91E135]ANF34437.1 hypothetical protein A7978_04830 [Borrelia turicatae]UPA14023.1 hypothetical protein bt91E135_001189 [Borrelia turicatae 91E135]UPA15515.1 hypothetical protein btBTE5EL_001199 [Borrelia turicatae]